MIMGSELLISFATLAIYSFDAIMQSTLKNIKKI